MGGSKIICTLGPASSETAVLKKMADAGMNVARLNFSHGTHVSHQAMIGRIGRLNKGRGQKVKILQDLEGYRIRVGTFKGARKSITLSLGQIVTLVQGIQSNRCDVIPFDYDADVRDIRIGCHIFIDDGNVALKVKSRTKHAVTAEVIVPGVVAEHKGINIPDADLNFQGLTDKDRRDMLFGISNGVDYIAQSFVRNADDVRAVRAFINDQGFNCPLIAKIENRQGVDNLQDILKVADGIMIARGDMGVSLPIYEVPMIQKKIIRTCRKRRRFVITATQMLESMTEHIRPTRAEVSDVANAIIDGTDYVMLSGETAAGKHPVATVAMMRDIVRFTEKTQTRRS